MSFDPFASVSVPDLSANETFPLGRHEGHIIGVRHSFRNSGAPQMSIHLRLDNGLCRWHNVNYARPSTSKITGAFLAIIGPLAGRPTLSTNLANCGWDSNQGVSTGPGDSTAKEVFDMEMTTWLTKSVGNYVALNVVASKSGGDPYVNLNPSKRAYKAVEKAEATETFNDDNIPF
jgi:hypothetical protein